MKTKYDCDEEGHGKDCLCFTDPNRSALTPTPQGQHTLNALTVTHLIAMLNNPDKAGKILNAVNTHEELLASLKDLKSMLSKNHDKFTNHAGFAYKMSRAEEAIARASGESRG